MGPEPKADQPEWLKVEDFADIVSPSNTSTSQYWSDDEGEELETPEETAKSPSRSVSQALVPQRARSLRPRRKRKNKGLFVAIVLLPVLIVGGIAFAMMRPRPVTVEITPRQERIHQAFNMQVQVQTLRVTSPSYTATHSVSGHVVRPASYATGTVTFFNIARYSQKVAAGTVLTGTSGKQVKTLAEIIVPPAAGPPLVMGQTEAHVQALQPGAQGNVVARDINDTCALCDPGLAALNSGPITGGQDAADYTTVLPQDVTAAAAPLQQQALAAAKEALQQQRQNGEKVIDASLSCKPTVQPQPKAQEQATEVTVQVTVTCEELSYSQEQLLSQITQQVQTQNAQRSNLAGYHLVGKPVYEVISYDPHLEAGQALFTLSVTSHYVYALKRELVQHMVISRGGKSWHDVRAALLRVPGVETVALRGGDDLPTNSDITIHILEVS